MSSSPKPQVDRELAIHALGLFTVSLAAKDAISDTEKFFGELRRHVLQFAAHFAFGSVEEALAFRLGVDDLSEVLVSVAKPEEQEEDTGEYIEGEDSDSGEEVDDEDNQEPAGRDTRVRPQFLEYIELIVSAPGQLDGPKFAESLRAIGTKDGRSWFYGLEQEFVHDAELLDLFEDLLKAFESATSFEGLCLRLNALKPRLQ